MALHKRSPVNVLHRTARERRKTLLVAVLLKTGLPFHPVANKPQGPWFSPAEITDVSQRCHGGCRHLTHPYTTVLGPAAGLRDNCFPLQPCGFHPMRLITNLGTKVPEQASGTPAVPAALRASVSPPVRVAISGHLSLGNLQGSSPGRPLGSSRACSGALPRLRGVGGAVLRRYPGLSFPRGP